MEQDINTKLVDFSSSPVSEEVNILSTIIQSVTEVKQYEKFFKSLSILKGCIILCLKNFAIIFVYTN